MTAMTARDNFCLCERLKTLAYAASRVCPFNLHF